MRSQGAPHVAEATDVTDAINPTDATNTTDSHASPRPTPSSDAGAAVKAVLSRLPMFAGFDLAAASVAPLGGVTNRSYRVALGAEAWVVRIPGAAAQRLVDRAAERANAAAVVGLGLDLTIPNLFFDVETGVKIGRWIASARPLSSEEIHHPERLLEIARLLRALHESTAEFQTAFSPRLSLPRCRQLLATSGRAIPAPLGDAAESWHRCVELLDGIDAPRVPCHQDLWRENLLRIDERLVLIDWEHSAPGDAMYDLADLAVQADLDPDREQLLVRSYLGRTPDPVERARFWMNKALSRLVWGAWALTRALVGCAAAAMADSGARRIAEAVAILGSQIGREHAAVLARAV